MNATRIACLAATLVVSACASGIPDTTNLPEAQYAGHLVTAADGSWFEPCGAAAPRMWVTFTGDAVAQIRAARADGVAAEGGRAFVRWVAALTDERHVGPGGPALLVRDIVEVRAARAGDCGE